MEDVIWKEIFGYEGFYEISDTGLVRSMERKVCHLNREIKINCKLLSCRINNSGYLEVRLSKNGNTATKFIHILKAQAYIPNPENKKEVNHKNGNKLDNGNDNLEWVTHSENVKHAYQFGLCTKERQQIPVFDKLLEVEFPSLKKAAEFYSIPYSTFKNYINGNRKNPTAVSYLQKLAA